MKKLLSLLLALLLAFSLTFPSLGTCRAADEPDPDPIVDVTPEDPEDPGEPDEAVQPMTDVKPGGEGF